GRRGEGKSADHGAANHEVHFSHRRRRSLPLQDLEVVTVIWLTSLPRITFCQSFGDFFSHRTSPSAILILPCQAIVLPGRAENMLCVLVPLGIIVLFLGILVLGLHETTPNHNGI